MAEHPETRCPICEHPSSGEATCPVCGWQLFGELQLIPESEAQDHARRLAQAQRQWQDALARFQNGHFGSDESALPALRTYLEQLGFHPGPAFESYARPLHPSPFGGSAFLGIQVQGLPPGQEALITLNHQPVGTTHEGYLPLRGLRPGRFRLQAITPTHTAAQDIEIREGAVLRVELTLQPGQGRLRVLPLVSGLTVQIGKQTVPAPCEVEVEAGAHTVVLRREGWTLPYPVTVRSEEVVELEVARMDKSAPAWVGKGHRGGVRSVVFSPDGRWVASGGEDRTVQIGRASCRERVSNCV